jgi:hypothetical protein
MRCASDEYPSKLLEKQSLGVLIWALSTYYCSIHYVLAWQLTLIAWQQLEKRQAMIKKVLPSNGMVSS